MDYLKEKIGMKGIRQMLDLLNDGKTDRESFEKVLDTPFRRFEADWKKWLGKQPRSTTADTVPLAALFQNKNQSKDEVLEIGENRPRTSYTSETSPPGSQTFARRLQRV